MNDTDISGADIRAYQDSDFHIDAAAPFVMQVGQRCDALEQLYREHGVNTASYISACNPGGESIGAAGNAARHAVFQQQLRQRGIAYVTGAAVDPRGKYPPEPGCLVLGMGEPSARQLGDELGQNAILHIASDCSPALVLLR